MSTEVGKLLMLRSSVSPLFAKIRSLRSPNLIIDFSRVEFMSRSFADEYLAAKGLCSKKIEERNVSPTIRQMLDLASQRFSYSLTPPLRYSSRLSFDIAPLRSL